MIKLYLKYTILCNNFACVFSDLETKTETYI